MGELDDVLAEIRLDGRHPRALEGRVQLDLLGGHRLGLHRHLHAAVPAQPEDDLAGLLAGGGPVDVAAEPLDIVGELLEVVVEALEGGFLDPAGAIAQGVALGEPREGLLPEIDELGGGDGERFLQVGVLQGIPGPAGKRRRQNRIGSRLSARQHLGEM